MMPMMRVSSCSRKIAVETIVPMKIAIPPNRGIALTCMRLPSFGTSIAPIFGASLIAAGVITSDSTNATKKVAHKVVYINVSNYSYIVFWYSRSFGCACGADSPAHAASLDIFSTASPASSKISSAKSSG